GGGGGEICGSDVLGLLDGRPPLQDVAIHILQVALVEPRRTGLIRSAHPIGFLSPARLRAHLFRQPASRRVLRARDPGRRTGCLRLRHRRLLVSRLSPPAPSLFIRFPSSTRLGGPSSTFFERGTLRASVESSDYT